MSTISKLNVDAIIDKSITSDKLADDFMLLSDALENEEVTAAALTDLNTKKADKTEIDEITQTLASKADAEVVSALQQDLDDKADASELNNYLPLSGGTMTGNLVTKQISVEAGNWVVTYGPGISLQHADGPSYIWNTASNSIAIGTASIGQSSELNAALVINGTNIYPGTSNKFSLGTDSLKFKDIFADGVIKGGRFLSGTKTKAELESNTNSGLSIATQVPLNESTAGDYGFNATNNANGVLAFRTHTGSGATYMHYLGFSQKGLFYRNNNVTNDKWTKLNNPSILSISVPGIEYSNSPNILPEIINGNITNVFHDIPQTMILIERSQDGTTWTDTTETDYPKFKQVMSTGKNASPVPCVANDTTQGQVGDRVRITVNGTKAYSRLSHLYVYFSTGGATVKLSVEYNTKDDQNTWITLIDKQSCVGWSGPNYYGLNDSLIGSPYTGNGYSYRITFEIMAISENYNNIGSIYNLWMLSPTKPYSITGNPTDMFYFDVKRWKHVTNKSIEPLSDVTGALGSSSYRWSSIYAKDFYGTNFYGTTGSININNNLNIGSGYGVNFNRNDFNYINIPIGDYSALVISKGGMAGANTIYVFNGSALFPYNNNSNDLGTSTKTWKNVYATKFVTTGGTASQVVLGDGTLKNLSEISSNVDSITTNNLILNGTSYTKLASGLIYSTLPRDTNTVPAGYYFWNQDTSQVISNYSGFNENTPDTIIIGEKITFNGDNIIKMDGLDDLNGGTIIYCLSYTPKGNIAINGAVYN